MHQNSLDVSSFIRTTNGPFRVKFWNNPDWLRQPADLNLVAEYLIKELKVFAVKA